MPKHRASGIRNRRRFVLAAAGTVAGDATNLAWAGASVSSWGVHPFAGTIGHDVPFVVTENNTRTTVTPPPRLLPKNFTRA
jgi:hypothetical protein